MKLLVLLLAGLQLAAASPAPQSNVGATPAGLVLEDYLDPNRAKTPGAQVKKLRYGPYTLGAMTMAENNISPSIQLPCTNCWIVAMQADLEDSSGRKVNIDSGAWLHHMVINQIGLGKNDMVCGLGMMAQRIFASGNERTPVRINGKYKYGIRVDNGDNFLLLYDLVNNSNNRVQFYITMTWEYTTDSSYKNAKMAWLDVTGDCGISYVLPRQGVYTLSNNNGLGWRSNTNGRLLSATGHVHDGGTLVTISQNGKVVCDSPQVYGRRPGYTEPKGAMNPGLAHISDTGSCLDFGQVKIGDQLVLKAYYNTSAHPLNKMHNGQVQEIMGISQVYIGD